MDYLFASIAHAIAETNRDSKKRKSPFQLGEFLIFRVTEEDEREPWEKTLQAMKQIG